MKQCSRCRHQTAKGQKYCEGCKKKVLREMRQSGYLENRHIYGRRDCRTQEMMEDTDETHWGVDD